MLPCRPLWLVPEPGLHRILVLALCLDSALPHPCSSLLCNSGLPSPCLQSALYVLIDKILTRHRCAEAESFILTRDPAQLKK